ncbi:MAG: ATPase domain-containing protein [Candidatus Thermoplasmatota archaeon]
MKPKIVGNRLKTYVHGLDEKLGGGIPIGYIVLVSGPSGSMKSSFTYSILYNSNLEKGTKGLYLSLEQRKDDLVDQMKELGMSIEKTKNFNVVDISKLRKELKESESSLDWLNSLVGMADRYKKEIGCDILAIDSLDALYSLIAFKNPRREIYHFFEGLRNLGMNVFLVSEMQRGEQTFGRHGVEEFLSDGIIHLKLKEVESGQITSVRRYIGIVKMRKTSHSTDYHPFLVVDGRFELVLK